MRPLRRGSEKAGPFQFQLYTTLQGKPEFMPQDNVPLPCGLQSALRIGASCPRDARRPLRGIHTRIGGNRLAM